MFKSQLSLAIIRWLRSKLKKWGTGLQSRDKEPEGPGREAAGEPLLALGVVSCCCCWWWRSRTTQPLAGRCNPGRD